MIRLGDLGSEIKRLPPSDYPILDLPRDHPVFHTMFDLKRCAADSGYQLLVSGGGTSERGADSAKVHARAISDQHGRVMVFMTHNTDVSDSWEREGGAPVFFYEFSVDGYRVAVNVHSLRDDTLTTLTASCGAAGRYSPACAP